MCRTDNNLVPLVPGEGSDYYDSETLTDTVKAAVCCVLKRSDVFLTKKVDAILESKGTYVALEFGNYDYVFVPAKLAPDQSTIKPITKVRDLLCDATFNLPVNGTMYDNENFGKGMCPRYAAVWNGQKMTNEIKTSTDNLNEEWKVVTTASQYWNGGAWATIPGTSTKHETLGSYHFEDYPAKPLTETFTNCFKDSAIDGLFKKFVVQIYSGIKAIADDEEASLDTLTKHVSARAFDATRDGI